MQAFHALLPQTFQCLDANLHMLADPLPVKRICHTRQLYLAMKRLVGDTEQRAVGNPKTIAVGRDGRRFHVDGNGTGLIELPVQGIQT